MGRNRQRTSAVFTNLAYGLRRKLFPPTVPLTESLGPRAPQTSLIFQLPDEIILSILSHISPNPQFIGYHARFRSVFRMETKNYHHERVRILLRLSVTCKAMWVRLRPWIWERLECPMLAATRVTPGVPSKKVNAIVQSLRADVSLATSVRFVTVYGMRDNSAFPKFVKCLESLPNLHTLEIGWTRSPITTPLKNVLKGVELPQIKTLILPPVAYPLLRHCRNVEDVVCVVCCGTKTSDVFLESLASDQDSKVERLAIPLVSLDNPSRYVTALPRLTELTLVFPFPDPNLVPNTGVPSDTIGAIRSTILGLIGACKTLPDFDTLQIAYFHGEDFCDVAYGYLPMGDEISPSMYQLQRTLMDRVNAVKELAVDCLKRQERGCHEGEGRKKTTLRVIELGNYLPPGSNWHCYRHSVMVEKVQEYEWGFDDKAS